ncbi:MAG: NAD-dependent epimerase/dehydratase family protein, partial [Gammaproteobacteria bacterium]|nr:NAD-dependent epimerase/dehydratase family protein [Gammaproteobacteria bacterium]
MPDSILLTGGVGFIGSHIAVEVARAGHRPVLLDNLCNSKGSVVERLRQIIGRAVDFVQGDTRNGAVVRKVI